MSKKMTHIKSLLILIVLLITQTPGLAFEQTYSSNSVPSPGTIHTVKIVKGWCGNMGVSTRVGQFINNQCVYEKETGRQGYDGCLLELNGRALENKVGKNYACGATFIHSNVDGKEALDEFIFIIKDGHYVDTQPNYSEVSLR